MKRGARMGRQPVKMEVDVKEYVEFEIPSTISHPFNGGWDVHWGMEMDFLDERDSVWLDI